MTWAKLRPEPKLGMIWFMEADVPMLENVLEGPSSWSGAVRWGLTLSFQNYFPLSPLLGCCFPKDISLGKSLGSLYKPNL